MKTFLTKYWRRLRYTEKDADQHLRMQCIAVAGQYQPKNMPDLLRGSQLIYDWIKGGSPPTDLKVAP
jgi:hypothetical protein